MVEEYFVIAYSLLCSDQISCIRSHILHSPQVSPLTWVSEAFKLTENNLFYYHLGLLAQTLQYLGIGCSTEVVYANLPSGVLLPLSSPGY